MKFLGVAGEQVQTLDRRLVRHAAGEEQVRVRIDLQVRIDIEQVLARYADQVLLDAAAERERPGEDRLLHVPLENLLRELPVVLLPVGLLVPVEAERRIQNLVPVAAQVSSRVLVPDAGAQCAARSPDGGEPFLVERHACAVLAVMAVAVRLHRGGTGVARRVDRRAARAVVVEDVGRRAPGHRPDGSAVRVHETDQPELRAAQNGCSAHQLRFRAAAVVGDVGDVGRQPVAAPPVAVKIAAQAQRGHVAERPVRLEVAERVVPSRLPAPAGRTGSGTARRATRRPGDPSADWPGSRHRCRAAGRRPRECCRTTGS